MGIIIKFIIKNIFEKKLRTFLILLSIIISSAVFFSSIAISGSLVSIIADTFRGAVGDSDIMIFPSEESNSPYVYTKGLEEYKDGFEYLIEELTHYGTYSPSSKETVNLNIRGIDYGDLQKMLPFSLEEGDLMPFEGQKVIISKRMADSNGLKIGDILTISSGDMFYRFRIAAIAKNQGPFAISHITVVVMPKSTVESMQNARGKSNTLYIKLKDSDTKKVSETVEELKGVNGRIEVMETLPYDELRETMSQLTIVFFILSSIVFFMSIFIIYSAFKIITTERIPVIGTLRSVGARKFTTNSILVGESIIYGVVGGILGCLLGIAILKIITTMLVKMSTVEGGLQLSTDVQYSPVHFVFTFFVALVMCFAGAIIPIMGVSKISVKDIILNTISKVSKKKSKKLYLGLGSLALAFILAFTVGEENGDILGGLCMILTLIAIVMLIPYLTFIFIKIFENLYVFLFGNIGILAAKNLRENKNLINNITMLAIGISSLVLINTSGSNAILETTNRYKDVKYDIEVQTSIGGRDVMRIISNVDGVEDVYGAYKYTGAKDKDSENKIGLIFGVNKTKMLDFWNLESSINSIDIYNELDSGRNIILTNTQKSRLEAEVGDLVTLEINGRNVEYKVIGFSKLIMHSADTALVSERFLKMDAQGMYSSYYVKTNNDAENVRDLLEEELKTKSPVVMTVNELKEQEIESSKGSVMLMQMFCILAMFIGCFGVINNLLISFIQRKHSIAVLRSVGMSKTQTIKMIFIEAFSGGTIGATTGVLGGVLMIFNMSQIGEGLQAYYPIGSFIIYIVVGALVMMLASISPAVKTSKIDLVSSLKYE